MQLIELFKNYLFSQKTVPSKVTVKNYLADTRKFISWYEKTFFTHFQPTQVTYALLEQFRKDMLASLSASSVERHMSTLRKFFHFLKIEGIISQDPFEAALAAAADARLHADPWHLKEFKNFLYVYNASHLTIKNYIIDVKQFLLWVKEYLHITDDASLLSLVSASLMEEYKQTLFTQKTFSATSINRKLSSLRKYTSWAADQGYANAITHVSAPKPAREEASLPLEEILAQKGIAINIKKEQFAHKKADKVYSSFPPLRVLQKSLSGLDFLIEKIIVTSLASLLNLASYELWKLKGKQLFLKSTREKGENILEKVQNISKKLYAPEKISLSEYTWYQKLFFHLKYTRPEWYKRYHKLAIAQYFNLAVLIIFSSAIGFGFYSAFIGGRQAKTPTFAATASPLRILSFQGRLTDNNDNPITTFKNLRFTIYDDPTATDSGNHRLWEEVRGVTPDQDGIFSTLLGSNGSGGTASLCGGGAIPPSGTPATGFCGIPQALFTQYATLYLGITVEDGSELTPRQQIATVPYASNAESLQGMLPITDVNQTTNANTILALNSSGTLDIPGTSPTTFQSTGGQLTIQGKTLVLNTPSGSNTNIQLAPDGSGFIDAQKPIQNSTQNNNIRSADGNSTAAGAVEVDDLFGVLATSSGQSAFTVNQDGAGPIISASHSGVAAFTLDGSGNGTFAGNIAGVNFAGTNLSLSGNVTSNLLPNPSVTYSLGDSNHQWLNLYAQNIFTSGGTQLTQLWQENLGALSPVNITDDLLLGATATSSAKFAFYNVVGSGTPTASISAGTNGGVYLTATGTIATTAKQTLTFGDGNTGDINFYSSSNKIDSTGNLTIAGTFSLPNNANITGVSNFVQFPNGIAVGGATTNKIDSSGNATLATGTFTGASALTLSANGATIAFTGTSGINQITTASNQNLSLMPNGTGAVAINTTAPVATFDVRGNLYTTPVASISGTTGKATLVVDQSGAGDIFTASQAGGTRFVIKNNGSVGIATANPTATLDVFGSLKVSSTVTFSSLNTNYGLLYANSGVLAQTTAGSIGQCLVSNGGTSSPAWTNCASGSGLGGFWTLDNANGTLYPVNSTVDLLVGGVSTNSAIFAVTGANTGANPTASVSATSGGNAGQGIVLGGDGSIQSLLNRQLTIGGSTTGNILLKPLNGSGTVSIAGTDLLATSGSFNLLNSTTTTIHFGEAGTVISIGAGTGTTTVNNALTATGVFTASNTIHANGGTIDTNQTTFNLVNGTATTINFGGGATTALNIGSNSSTIPINLEGNITLGNAPAGTNTITSNGYYNSDIIPTGNANINLGSSAHYYGTLYVNSISVPVGNGINGFWNLTNNVLSPVAASMDLAVGGDATGSATPFQVFSQTVGGTAAIAGTATTSGNLTFRNGARTINAVDGASLNFQTSVGGDAGLSSRLYIDNSGNIGINTTSPTALFDINGNATSSGNLSFRGTATSHTISINDGGNLGFYTSVGGSAVLDPSLYISSGTGTNFGKVGIGTTTPVNALDVRGALAVGAYAGTNTAPTNGLLVSGNVGIGTSSPLTNLQVAGSASVSANLSYYGTGTAHMVSVLDGGTLNFVRSAGGDTVTSSTLYLNSNGNIGIGTTNPSAALHLINTSIADQSPLVIFGDNSSSTRYQFLADNGSGGEFQIRSGTARITTQGDLTLKGATGVSSIYITQNTGSVSIGTTSNIGNAMFVVNQQNYSGPGDIFSASTSGTPKFTIANDGTIKNSLNPNADLTYDLGTATLRWNNIYAANVFSSGSSGTSGFWSLANNVIYPANPINDLAVGGTSTASAAWQVFGSTIAAQSAVAGTATSSGNLAFRSTNTRVDLLNNANLGFYNSVGGNAGLSSNPSLYILNSGNTNPGNVGIGTSNPSSFALQVAGNAGPNADNTYDLGSSLLRWRNLNLSGNITIAGNIFFPVSGGTDGFWQLASNVIAPSNLANDLAIGGNSTSSAKFQVFGANGNASTSANLTYYGTATAHTVNINNGGSLGFYTSVGGTAVSTPSLYIASGTGTTFGNVGIGTTNPSGQLHIASSAIGGTQLKLENDDSGGRIYKFISTGTGSSVGSGYLILSDETANTTRLAVSTGGFIGIGSTSMGNAQLLVNQANLSGIGDIFAASSSGTTKFLLSDFGALGLGSGMKASDLGNGLFVANQTATTGDIFSASVSGVPQFAIKNNGNVGIGSTAAINPQGTFHIASTSTTNDLIVNQTTSTNYVTQPSFENNSLALWNVAAEYSISTDRSMFGSRSLKFTKAVVGVNDYAASSCITNISPSTTYMLSAYIYRVAGYSGNTGIDMIEYSGANCTTQVADDANITTTTTNQWVRVSGAYTTTGTTASVQVRFVNDNSSIGTAYLDGFQLEQGTVVTPYLDGSFGPGYYWSGIPASSSSTRIPGATFAQQTFNSASGIGASSYQQFPTLQLDQNGTGDLIAASVSGVTKFRVDQGSGSGAYIYAGRFVDIDNSNGTYYVDPAAVGTGLSLAGTASISANLTFSGAGTSHLVKYLDNGTINFARSVGGDASTTSTLFLDNTGNVGIGTTTPDTRLEVASRSAYTESLGSPNNAAIRILNTNTANFNEKAELQFAVGGSINTTAAITALYTDWTSPGGGSGLIGSDLAFSTKTSTGLLTEAMRIKNNGNIGIGTTSPGVLLDVRGTSQTITGNAGILGIYSTDSQAADKGGSIVLGGQDGTSLNRSFAGIYGFKENSTSSNYNGYLAFATRSNGGNLAEAMRIDSSGNVGIGTTGPNAVLEVVGSGATAIGGTPMSSIFRTSGGALATGLTANLNLASIGFKASGNSVALGIHAYRDTGGGSDWTTSNILLGMDVDNTASAGAFLSLSHSDGIGINTANPLADLHLMVNGATSGLSSVVGRGMAITGNAAGRDRLYFENTAATTGQRVLMMDNGNTSGVLSFSSLADNAGSFVTQNIFNIKYNGNVGIGTTNPGSPLDISGGSTDKVLQMESSNTGQTYIDINNTTGHEFELASGGSANTLASGFYIYDVTAAARRLNIDSSGNMGVNTTTMTEMFNVNGRVAANGYRTRTGIAGSFGNNNFNINWTAGGCLNFWIDTTNEGQAGTTCPSDQRLKTDVQPIGNALSQINQLTPITFNWKQGTDNGTDLQTGFLAQDVMKIFPELVDHTDQITPWTPDGMYRLNYVGLIAPAIRAIQEISATQSAHTTALANLTLNTTGDINISDSTPSADFAIPHYFTLNDALGKPITQMGAFVELVVGNLRAGSVNAQQVLTNSLAVATDNVSIAGKSLQQYILDVVNHAGIVANGGHIISPLADIDTIHTNIISPLSSSAIRIDGPVILSDSTATPSANKVLLDVQGSASIAGTLNSNNLAVNSDATISGTLRAHRIIADDIEGLAAKVGTLSAQNITNVTNIYFATPSATGQNNNSTQSGTLAGNNFNGALTNGYVDVASYSALLAYTPNLQAEQGVFTNGIMVSGPTALTDTTIAGQLAIGGQFILSENSINVLGGDLRLQPLKQGGVDIAQGAIKIDSDGNLTVNGTAVFNGTLAAKVISPLAGQDLTIKLGGGGPTDTSTNLQIQNASGSAVFKVNQLGDVVASGTASIAKLNLQFIQPAHALSNTEVVATGSAGTTTINAYQREITIDNPLITQNSLIYVTPVGQTFGETPALIRQVPGQSFTVGIEQPITEDIKFNWLIVN